ncbi:MAG: DNA mismatch repair protein MutS [Candidatus Eisenbacteria bacterium]|nr:DNA mismatch repair protein MutS [Candidatus Eisenbacteria bacterium]
MSTSNPHAVYTARAAERRATEAALERRHLQFSFTRVGLFVAELVLLWVVFGANALSAWWLLPPVALFLFLAVRHEDVVRRRDRARRAAEHYEQGLARLENRWQKVGPDGARFLDAEHPYAIDLDLFGEGSLFRLLCRARSSAGEARLAQWLLTPAEADQIRNRQAAVRELAPELGLREELAVLGAEVETQVHAKDLTEWCALDAPAPNAIDRWLALALGLAGLVAVLGWIAGWWRSAPVLGLALLQLPLRARWKNALRRARLGADHAVRDLKLLSETLARLERTDYQAPLLAQLRARLHAHGAPSAEIRALDRRVDGYEARRNAMLAPFTALFLLDVQFGLAIEAWRVRHGQDVPDWLDIVAEFEALSSLASYAHETPDAQFPAIVATPHFEAESIGHPLLPHDRCVRNSVRVTPTEALLVISGSNMSGKSTFLRTIGLAAVLAQAGAPLRATSLTIGPLALGASIRIVDSLQDGTSRFYAEVKRVRQIVELTKGDRPVLFLVDEIFQGTNSHDRRIGVETILASLLERGALGLITTHDLALTEIVDRLAPRARNVHFEDHLEEGRMVFDYTLRDGVVAKSNALALMRSVGLDV